MKSLKEYIEDYHEIEYDFLDECVLNHCYIHYNFNYRKASEYHIYESDGAFPGEHELVKIIKKEIEQTNDANLSITIDNNIVEKISIHLKHNKENDISGSYVIDNEKYDDYNDIRWDNNKKRFIFVEINIYNYDKNPAGLEEILYHELEHLWEDYIFKSKKNIFLSDHVIKTLSNNLEDTNELVDNITYYGEKFEISAYIAQLNGLFGNKKFDDIKNAFNEIVEKSSIYQNYKYLYYAINNEDKLEELKNYLSDKDIKYFIKNINDAWHKIINHSYTICGKHISKKRLGKSTRRKIN
ncbi:MAG: hypothetical protein J1F35_06620 [Erysipelotrichales bacterium]|nr:hypothetical protein [Erysipelotrichales bacterium]